jgi:broad specificity phosphatase PhoE
VILFVRHGQTAPNRAGLLLGHSDPELTVAGSAQAEALAAYLSAVEPTVVVSSPLRRARATAEPIAAACGVGVDLDDRLIEIDYGQWEGRPFAELPAAVIECWRRDPGFAPPEGESLTSVRTRVAGFCADVLGDEAVVVAVSHVSPIKAAVAWALGVGDEITWRMRLDVGTVTRIGIGPTLLSFNESAQPRAE